MHLRHLGILGMIISVSILSLECFLLRMVQALEQTSGSWYYNVAEYAKEPIILLSFALVIGVLIYSIICIFWDSEKK